MATNYAHMIDIIYAVKNAGATKKEIQKVQKALTKTGKASKKSAKKIGDFEKALRRAAIVAPVWMALRTAMMAVFDTIKDQAKFLVELETVMARIKIVGKGTAEEFIMLKDGLLALSYAYGVSAKDAVEAAKVFCYDKETEIFTNDGWKYFKDLKGNELVYSMNLDTQKMSYEKIEENLVFNYNGIIYLNNTQKMNFCITPNHKIVTKQTTKPKSSDNLILKEIKDVGSSYYLKKGFNWNGKKQNYSKEFIELLGWFISEGYVHKENEIVIYQKKQKNIDEICKLLTNLNYKYHISTDKRNNCKAIGFNNKKLANLLNKICYIHNKKRTSKTKKIPSFLKQANKEQIEYFLDSFVKGDGTIQPNNIRQYFTSSKQLADDLQELILKYGHYASITVRYGGFKNSLGYIISESLVNEIMLKSKNIQKINYNDKVYCVTTKYHTVYVRRNGKCHWSGNSQQGKTVRETLALTQSAMLASQVLGLNVKTSVENLTAAIKGFNIPMEESIGIVDKWIGVEKEFAVTATDLANATKRVGATANALGISISEMLGDVTAVIEVTRQSGQSVARGLQFIYARLFTTAKPVVEQIAKISFYLDEEGKATSKLTDTLRPASDILGEIAFKWKSLTKEQRLQISTSLASKRQMTTLNALMNNYNRSIEARIKSLTSAGQAERAFGILQDTTTYKIKQYHTAWNNLTNAIGDTSSFKSSLNFLNKTLIVLTSLIDTQKAYRQLISEPITKEKLEIETQKTRVGNLKEIIALRDKLSKAPSTDENIERIKILNDAIKEIVKTEPSIGLAIDTGNVKKLNKAIEDIQKKKLLKTISLDVQFEIYPKIQKQLEIIRKQRNFLSRTEHKGKREAIIKKANEEINKLYKEQNDSIELQYKERLAQWEVEKGIKDAMKEEENLSGELTESEKEQLEIERELFKIKIDNIGNIGKQISLEMDLIKNSNYLYDAHSKTLKLEELQNKLIDERIKKREKEHGTIQDLVLEYEKATGAERGKIKRLIELQVMQPSQVQRQFETSSTDKRLILENVNKFTEEIKNLIAQSVARERGIYEYTSRSNPYTGAMKTPYSMTNNQSKQQIKPVSISNIGANNININVEAKGDPEEIASETAKKVKSSLLIDDDFQKAFSKKISNKI